MGDELISGRRSAADVARYAGEFQNPIPPGALQRMVETGVHASPRGWQPLVAERFGPGLGGGEPF